MGLWLQSRPHPHKGAHSNSQGLASPHDLAPAASGLAPSLIEAHPWISPPIVASTRSISKAGRLAGAASDPGANAVRSEGESFHLNSKITESVRKRVGERCAGADDSALPGAFDAERVERRGRFFEYHAANIGHIRARGQ